jgi:hypothetical protein
VTQEEPVFQALHGVVSPSNPGRRDPQSRFSNPLITEEGSSTMMGVEPLAGGSFPGAAELRRRRLRTRRLVWS